MNVDVLKKYVPQDKEVKYTVVTEKTMPVNIKPVISTVTKEIIKENFPNEPIKVEDEIKIKQ